MTTTFDYEAFAKNVRRYVAQGSGVEPKYVLPGFKDGQPVPDEVYATVLLIDDRQLGYVGEAVVDDPDDEHNTLTYQRNFKRAVFSVQFYRAGALATAHRFVAWMQSPFSQEYEGLYCFSPQPPFIVRDLSDIIGDDWEGRASLDLSLDYAADYRYSTGRIETADDLTVDEE